MMVTSISRADPTNVGDWYSPPKRYFELPGPDIDIIKADGFDNLRGAVVVGGGGLIAETFRPAMEQLALSRPRLQWLVAWGIGESLHVDRRGGFVAPYPGALPDYLRSFDLLGLRDFGTGHTWVPCASCLLPQFDIERAAPTEEIVLYEHKRIRIPIEGFPRLTNDGNDVDAALSFLASGEVVITNSYHGVYWGTLLGRRVFAIPNMSKIYRFKHAPVIGRADDWRRLVNLTISYPEALKECRAANLAFHAQVQKLTVDVV